MKKNDKITHNILKSVIQKMVTVESLNWPPYTMCGIYQSQRPNVEQLLDYKEKDEKSIKAHL